MAEKPSKRPIFAALRRAGNALSLPELSAAIEHAIPERTLRRWLSQWVHDGQLVRSGNRRSTRYRLPDDLPTPEFEFLNGLNESWKHHMSKSTPLCEKAKRHSDRQNPIPAGPIGRFTMC